MELHSCSGNWTDKNPDHDSQRSANRHLFALRSPPRAKSQIIEIQSCQGPNKNSLQAVHSHVPNKFRNFYYLLKSFHSKFVFSAKLI